MTLESSVHRLADQRVCRLRPHSSVVELAHQPGSALDFLAIDGDQLVVRLDSGFCARTVRVNPVRHQPPIMLHPPDTIIRDGGIAFFLEIKAGKDDRSHRKEE